MLSSITTTAAAAAALSTNPFRRNPQTTTSFTKLHTKPKHLHLHVSSCRRCRLRSGSHTPILIVSAASSSSVPNGGETEEEPKQNFERQQLLNKNRNEKLKLALIFGLWYFQNVVFNIYNKKTLNVFPYPWFLATFQLLAGSLFMSGLWLFKLYPLPAISRRFIGALLAPALFHTIGHVSACVSFSKVAVSFTHVIKASEPAFSVAISALFGSVYPLPVWLSIVPIVGGCALAAVTEMSFDVAGLWGALISNVAFVFRNITSKNNLKDFKDIDGLNLYGFISIVSLVYLAPVAVFIEGPRWMAGMKNAVAAVRDVKTLCLWMLVSGVFYHLYNQTSYQALDQISPLTFSVGNTMKRVVVIVASVLVFRNPVRPMNALGSAVAILGTFLYSQATAMATNSNQKQKDI